MIRRIVLAGCLLLAACAPRLERPGPDVTAPSLADGRFIAADGAALPMRSWLPKGKPWAVVLGLHGFNDYSEAFTEVGKYLARRGVALYAYDQRGFGETAHRGLWPGTPALVGDLKAVSAQVRARHPDIPFFLLGESMGGAVVMAAMTDPEPPATDGIVLAAPAIWGRVTMPWYQRLALAVASHTVPWLTLTGQSLHVQASDNIEMLRALARDPLVIKDTRVDTLYGLTNLMDRALAAAPRLKGPALILYGEKDEIIPREAMFRMLRSLPEDERWRQRIALYKNGYHMLLRDLEAKTVWEDIDAWLDDPHGPLPSGADVHACQVLGGQAGKAGPATKAHE